MAKLRNEPLESLGGLKVVGVRDFLNQVTLIPGGAKKLLAGPRDDLVIIDLEKAGNYAAVRPSGTEPKVKFYNFAYEPAEQLANLDDTKAECTARLIHIEKNLSEFGTFI